MLRINKIKPLFTSLITTMDKYEQDIITDGGLIDTSKQQGTLKEYQTVLAIGDSVRNIKVGDLVCVNPSRFAVKKHREGSMRDGVITDNPIVTYNFDIVETLKAIAKDFEPLFESKKIAYDIDYESLNKRTAYTDYNAIKRTFRNILEVALNMTDSGYISIKISHPDEQAYCAYGITANKLTSYVQITVRDTSAGIAEDEMKYLCEPYAQLEKGKKNFLRALQLGSASILTKRANGHIRVFSEVMKGTKYEIVLPIEKELNE